MTFEKKSFIKGDTLSSLICLISLDLFRVAAKSNKKIQSLSSERDLSLAEINLEATFSESSFSILIIQEGYNKNFAQSC